MDCNQKFYIPSPELNANVFNRLFYCWVLPFFKHGYQNDLEIKDIYSSVESDLSGPLADRLERNWYKACKESKDSKPKLQTVIFNTFWKTYLVYGFFLFIQSVVLKSLLPLVLARYIKFYEKSCDDKNKASNGWLMGSGVVVLSFLAIAVWHHVNLGLSRVGMRVRIASCSIIYRKLLRLSQQSLSKVSAGKLVNLLSNDVSRFEMAAQFLHFFWITPIQTFVSLYIMYSYIGVASFPAVGAVCLQAIVIQGYLSKKRGQYRSQIAQLTDNRVKIMSEITSGIQVIKMYSWEKPFDNVVELARKAEVGALTKTSYIQGFASALCVFTERATLFIAVSVYVLLGNTISGDIVFSLAQLINTVQLYVSIFLPYAFTAYAEMKVTINRIEEIMYLEENTQSAIKDESTYSPDGSIKFQNVTASWLPNPISETLININLELKPGTLCCVIGSVGSGKSTLLQVLLKEVPLKIGSLRVNGKISYAAQEPWLFVSNIRQNILFGAPYDKERYKKVVKVCALERDFQQLPHGDATLVGEKGTALSGGQRARVALARAIYREADIYLLDDPLSAVDAHVAKHLFEKCVYEYLEDKTRVLVTHQVQFLKKADLIVVMNNGKIERVGTYSDLPENEISNLSKELEQYKSQEIVRLRKKSEADGIIGKEKNDLNNLQSNLSIASSKTGDDEPQETQELIEKGSLSGDLYVQYFKNGASLCVLIFMVFLLLVAQLACNGSDMWIKYWTNTVEEEKIGSILQCAQSLNDSILTNSPLMDEEQATTTPTLSTITTFATSEFLTNPEQPLSRDQYLYVYLTLILASVILTTARSFLFMKVCMNASKNLHKVMFSKVLRAPMRFFDTNPSGRILNRFSKDIGAIDELLPKCMIDSIQIFLVMAGILGMVFIVNVWMLIPAVILGTLFSYSRQIYLGSAQDIKRLEGITKAPVFSHVAASLYGISTIRALNTQDLISREFDGLQDTHTATTFLFLAISEALGFYLDVISTIFLALVTFQFLLFDQENVSSGNVGLSISQSLILTGMLQMGIRQSAEVTSNMTSVERVLQYTHLEEEGPWEPLPADRPPLEWPQNGQLLYKNVFLKYAPEMSPALKNLNLEIRAREKIGVVGRTGAGKSTMVASLFRLAPIDGTILLDGLDTGKVGLNNLRSNISIIPQAPTLFSSTIRYNLDPFARSTDDALWQALERVELRSAITSLGMPVSEGGSNFSAGQRQLLCLARAIVRNNKVLVMDEATANVDPQTDGLIQKTIRESFKDCTVITVAHRLNTIIDADKVLVMEFGQAVEFAPPHELLQNPNSYFSRMVKETGYNMENKLRSIAENSYKSAIVKL